jgi:RHS repeat-associated protein
LGSIRQVLDADQSTQNSYDYQAFGEVYGSLTENLTQPFRFTGREWDGESGLYYYRMRNYGAEVGRFLARDPLVLRPAYAYVLNAPTVLSDPFGLDVFFNTYPGDPWPGHVDVWVEVYDQHDRVIGYRTYSFVPADNTRWTEAIISPLGVPGLFNTNFVPPWHAVFDTQEALKGINMSPSDTRAFLGWADRLVASPPRYGWSIFFPVFPVCSDWFQGWPGMWQYFPGLRPRSPEDLRKWLEDNFTSALPKNLRPEPPKPDPCE